MLQVVEIPSSWSRISCFPKSDINMSAKNPLPFFYTSKFRISWFTQLKITEHSFFLPSVSWSETFKSIFSLLPSLNSLFPLWPQIALNKQLSIQVFWKWESLSSGNSMVLQLYNILLSLICRVTVTVTTKIILSRIRHNLPFPDIILCDGMSSPPIPLQICPQSGTNWIYVVLLLITIYFTCVFYVHTYVWFPHYNVFP